MTFFKTINYNYKVSKMAATPDNKDRYGDLNGDYKVLTKDEYDDIMAARPKTSINTPPTPPANWVPFYKYSGWWIAPKIKVIFPKSKTNTQACTGFE